MFLTIHYLYWTIRLRIFYNFIISNSFKSENFLMRESDIYAWGDLVLLYAFFPDVGDCVDKLIWALAVTYIKK